MLTKHTEGVSMNKKIKKNPTIKKGYRKKTKVNECPKKEKNCETCRVTRCPEEQ